MNRFAPRLPLLWLVLPLALYVATLGRTIGLPDSVILLDAMSRPLVSSHANNHSLNNLAGFLFQQLPVGDLVFRSNLTAAVFGTAALGFFFALLRTLGASSPVAGLSTAALMVSHSFWWHGTQAESYGLSALLLCAVLLLVARAEEGGAAASDWRWPLAAFLAGLALFNHLQNGSLALAFAALAVARRREFTANRCALLLRCAAAYAAGLAPHAASVVADLVRSEDRAATAAWMTGGGFRQLMFQFQPAQALADFAHWVLLQFPSPFLLLVPAGAAVAFRAAAHRGTLVFAATVFLVNTLFFMGYKTWDQFAFYLPSFVCLALAGGIGASHLEQRAGRGRRGAVLGLLALGALLPPLVYVNIPRWAASGRGYWHGRYGAAHEAFRGRFDLVGMYVDPVRHDRGTIEAFVRSLLAGLPPRAWLIDDVSACYQVDYLRRREDARPDLKLLMLQPPGMAGWGTAADEIVRTGLLAPARLFIVSTNGPCAPVVAAFARHQRRAVPFDLGGGRRVYELEFQPLETPAP